MIVDQIPDDCPRESPLRTDAALEQHIPDNREAARRVVELPLMDRERDMSSHLMSCKCSHHRCDASSRLRPDSRVSPA